MQIEYLFSFHIIFSRTLLPGICLRGNIPVTTGKELGLSLTVEKYMQNILINYGTKKE